MKPERLNDSMVAVSKSLEEHFPKKLYKYRNGNSVDLITLSKKKIWVPNFFNLDDPAEYHYQFDMADAEECALFFTPMVLRNKYGEPVAIPIELRSSLPEEQKEAAVVELYDRISKLRELIYSKGVYCLSESALSNPMWSKYGNGHKGYCLEFDIPPLGQLVESKNSRVPKGVEYVERRKRLPWKYLNLYPAWSIEYHMLGFKDSDYSYEKEWRIIFESGEREYDIPFPISAVIFGLNADNSLIDELRDILGDSVVYKKAVLKDGLKMEVVEIV